MPKRGGITGGDWGGGSGDQTGFSSNHLFQISDKPQYINFPNFFGSGLFFTNSKCSNPKILIMDPLRDPHQIKLLKYQHQMSFIGNFEVLVNYIQKNKIENDFQLFDQFNTDGVPIKNTSAELFSWYKSQIKEPYPKNFAVNGYVKQFLNIQNWTDDLLELLPTLINSLAPRTLIARHKISVADDHWALETETDLKFETGHLNLSLRLNFDDFPMVSINSFLIGIDSRCKIPTNAITAVLHKINEVEINIIPNECVGKTTALHISLPIYPEVNR